jgi:hypothetical protein
MNFEIDLDVQMVLEFMQKNLPVARLKGVAEAIPQMAALLWSRYPQEAVIAAFIRGKPLASTECVPIRDHVDGGFGAEVCAPAQ